MSNSMQKIFTFFTAAILLFCLAGCQNTKSDSDSRVNSAPEEIRVLSPRSAVDLYCQYTDVWMEKPEHSPANGYGYCLLDLDFDGVLELISSVCDGSGKYSTNSICKIDPEEKTVYQIYHGSNTGLDYYYLRSETKLLRNEKDGSLFYLVMDYTRVNNREGGTAYYRVSEKDKTISETCVFSEITTLDAENGTDEKIREYAFGEESCTKIEYDKKLREYYEENTDLHVKWKAVNGKKFKKSDENGRKKLLSDAYNSFSYDGFSLEDLKTYDIPTETANTDPNIK